MPTDNNLAERIAVIRERWSSPSLPEMVFSGHAKMDIDFLIAHVEQLEREVERLREQWNTRSVVLCGNCGAHYLGPRDDNKHGIGKCGNLAQHVATEGRDGD